MSDERDGAFVGRALRPVPVRRVRSVALTGIFILLLLYALYFAQSLVVPFVFAVILKLLLQPGVRLLARVHIRPVFGGLFMIALLLGGLGGIGYMLSVPAAEWIQKAPQSLPRLGQKLSVIAAPLGRMQEVSREIEKIAAPEAGANAVTVRGKSLLGYVYTSTGGFLAGLGLTIVLLYFLLVAGDLFLRRLVEILPNFTHKRQAVAISHEVEEGISAYLMTVSGMNLLVGVATALAMWAIGLSDALLWGVLAFALNYVLILGPIAMIAIFFCVGLLSFDSIWPALLPPAAYLAIHLVEGEFATPMLLARHFTLNPVLVIGSIIFWNWMWGIPGAFVAVPMLACFKIVCDWIEPLAAIGHFIGGERSE